ncbi:MAG: flagellar hook-basal body protein [bacterium]
MLKGLELTGRSMATRMAQMDAITNNLANISTRGFKRDMVFIHSVAENLRQIDRKDGSVQHRTVASTTLDLTQGSLVGTERPLDLAISGDGFFVVETSEGAAYTRNGQFTLNAEGVLTTLDGKVVLGEGGAIEINIDQKTPNQILINEQGEILLDGNLIDKLQIVAPENPNKLLKAGANLFKLADETTSMQPVELVSVKQGFLEESNVNPMLEMIAMMENLQHFQMDQKIIKTEDEMLGRAANNIGRVT